MDKYINVALVNIEPLFLEGLSLFLSECSLIQIVSKVNRGCELLDKMEELSFMDFPQVILLDVETGSLANLELVKCLKKKYRMLRVIVLTSQYHSTLLGSMIAAGASAVLSKKSSLEVLMKAIKSVYDTGTYFNPSDHKMLTSYIRNQINKSSASIYKKLSEREKEVLLLICKEFTNSEIAEKLFLSKRTVESHRQRIICKTGAKNTAGLVTYAICHYIFIPQSFP